MRILDGVIVMVTAFGEFICNHFHLRFWFLSFVSCQKFKDALKKKIPEDFRGLRGLQRTFQYLNETLS